MPIPYIQPLPTVTVHNDDLSKFIKERYTVDDISSLQRHLEEKGCFNFPTVPGRGLFRAAAFSEDESNGIDYTGYSNVWVRDNIHIAHAHLLTGKAQQAVAVTRDIARFWNRHINRFLMCISGRANTENPMERPHIRFEGTRCEEILTETWSHAQNDAIGYFVWLTCKLGRLGHLNCGTEGDLPELLSVIALYLYVVGFWSDPDNGHWEEAMKVEASSIGTATAGLRELRLLAESHPSFATSYSERWNAAVAFLRPKARPEFPLLGKSELVEEKSALQFLKQMEEEGVKALTRILPYESRDLGQERRTDGALLFLVYPLGIVEGAMAAQIVADVVGQLAGDHGIRRYLGDSYWMADYKTKFSEDIRTCDFSADMSVRDKHLQAGQEAQWCIFDPIVASICGIWALEEKDSEKKNALFELHTRFLSRSIGQITGKDCQFEPYRCPESYYIENGVYVPNDICPLLWTQANLQIALHTAMEVARKCEIRADNCSMADATAR